MSRAAAFAFTESLFGGPARGLGLVLRGAQSKRAEDKIGPKRKSRAFTLTELLIVIAILGILVTILVPVVTNQIEKARRTSCANNQHVIGMKLMAYAHGHKGRLPGLESATAWWNAVGHNNNVPSAKGVSDGTRPLFMLMYEPDGLGRRATEYITAPDVFVCPSVGHAEPDPMLYDNQVGFTSYENISYSYQHQLKVNPPGFSLTILSRNSRVVLADKNPLTEFKGTTGQSGGTTFYSMQASGKPYSSMSANHGEGQNVLTLGGTVEFTSAVTSGTGGDNIWAPANKAAGNLGGSEVPDNKEDVFLVP